MAAISADSHVVEGPGVFAGLADRLVSTRLDRAVPLDRRAAHKPDVESIDDLYGL